MVSIQTIEKTLNVPSFTSFHRFIYHSMRHQIYAKKDILSQRSDLNKIEITVTMDQLHEV